MPVFNVRMPPDMKEALGREARINGRSLNSEIVERLRLSLAPQPPAVGLRSEDSAARLDAYARSSLTDPERSMLTLFRRFSPEQQLALLSLFK